MMTDETQADARHTQRTTEADESTSLERDWIDEHIFDEADEMLDTLAEFVVRQLGQALIQQGSATLVATGGGTPKPLYTRLQRMDVDWSKVVVTLSDERWVAPTDPRSNQKLIQESLLVGLAGRAAFVPLLTSHKDPSEAERVLGQRLNTLSKPYNLTILGMGSDGHIASLFPDCPEIQTGLTSVEPCIGVHPAKTDTPRLSLTLREILNSPRIVLLITGQEKWDVYQDALSDLDSQDYSALPVRALLAQQRVPIHVFWSP
ncbi:MAG: 6-phosphogluconolactonase [Gammaproteobacteria bacterium]